MRLHDYQVVARDFLRRQPHACLFLDMGLGKTAAALTALTPEQLPALIVAPKRVAEFVWPKERSLWRPDLTIALAIGAKTNRLRELTQEKDLIVIGRDNIRDVLTIKRATPFKTIIIDELSGFKSRSSIRWRTAKKIVRQPAVTHVWGLSGTPTPNGLMDLWAQLALIDSGERLGKTLGEYRARYFRPGRRLPTGIVTEWILREKMDEKIHHLIEDICLSMETEGRIKLPPVTHNDIVVDLPPAVRRAYRDMKRDLVANLDLLGGEVHSAVNAATLTNKLSQISAGFMYVDDADIRGGKYDILHREKVRAVQEVIEGTGSPVLVFYRYVAELELLKEALPQARTIDEPLVLDDWDLGLVPVLLAHPASAGHGLNLQHGGHTIVWTSLTWSLEEWSQANKRLARQGQKHPIVIHRIMAKKSVDYVIESRLEDKANVQDALLAHLESPI